MVAIGGDLEPGTLLAAYRSGLFPMGSPHDPLTWWSPDPRGILDVDALRVTESLRRSCRRFVIRVDTAFEAVIDACAGRNEEKHDWITPEIRDAYVRLHRLGWAHSVEAWTPDTANEPAQLAGGLYGIGAGGLFAGESMFHRLPDASKVALVGLVGLLRDDGRGTGRLIDIQWLTPHLESLGACDVRREEYLARLDIALRLPLPAAFA